MVDLRKAARGRCAPSEFLATAITIRKRLCWRITDWRVKTSDYTKEELRLMHAEGVFRTQEIWRKDEVA